MALRQHFVLTVFIYLYVFSKQTIYYIAIKHKCHVGKVSCHNN